MTQDAFNDKDVRESVAAALRDKFATVTEADVLAVLRYGSVDEGVVGESYDEALTDAIIEELDRRGIRT